MSISGNYATRRTILTGENDGSSRFLSRFERVGYAAFLNWDAELETMPPVWLARATRLQRSISRLRRSRRLEPNSARVSTFSLPTWPGRFRLQTGASTR